MSESHCDHPNTIQVLSSRLWCAMSPGLSYLFHITIYVHTYLTSKSYLKLMLSLDNLNDTLHDTHVRLLLHIM